MMDAPAQAQIPRHGQSVGRLVDRAPERRDAVVFVEDRSRDPRHQAQADKLAQEHHAPLFTAADITAQVELRKMPVARPGYAEDARVAKVKGDQADKGVAVDQVQLQSPREVPPQDAGRDRIREDTQIDPVRGHERAHDSVVSGEEHEGMLADPKSQPREGAKSN